MYTGDDGPRAVTALQLGGRVYALDVLVSRKCGGRLRIIAFISDVRVVRRILDHLHIPPVGVPRARPPPQEHLPGIDQVYDPCVDPPAAD